MEFTFSEIKNTHFEIKEMLEDLSCDKVEDLHTKIAEDLSLYGDDNYDFLVKFVERYQLDWGDFNYDEYFLSEGELTTFRIPLTQIVYLPLAVFCWFISLLFPKVKNPFAKYYEVEFQERDDLTFGDLIAWKLKGTFCLRKNLHIKLAS